MNKKITLIILPLLVLYFAWPFYSANALFNAIYEQDSESVNDKIDFPSLRSSLKEQLNANMLNTISTGEMKDNPFSGLALAFVPKLIDSAVDAYVTPAGLKNMISEQEGEANEPLSFDDVSYAFFKNPTKFKITANDVDMTFRLTDWTWKLTDLIIPVDELNK